MKEAPGAARWSGWRWCAGIDRGGGSRLGTPGCGSTRPAGDSGPAHYEPGRGARKAGFLGGPRDNRGHGRKTGGSETPPLRKIGRRRGDVVRLGPPGSLGRPLRQAQDRLTMNGDVVRGRRDFSGDLRTTGGAGGRRAGRRRRPYARLDEDVGVWFDSVSRRRLSGSPRTECTPRAANRGVGCWGESGCSGLGLRRSFLGFGGSGRRRRRGCGR